MYGNIKQGAHRADGCRPVGVVQGESGDCRILGPMDCFVVHLGSVSAAWIWKDQVGERIYYSNLI